MIFVFKGHWLDMSAMLISQSHIKLATAMLRSHRELTKEHVYKGEE